MNGLSVIIPSKTVSNLVPCLSAIFVNEKDIRVIVVDDGLEYPNAEVRAFCAGPRVTTAPGEKPFVFARNVNLGIAEAASFAFGQRALSDDVVVLNDDALLETPGGFTALQRCAEAHPEFGIISTACNNVGNINQHNRGTGGLRREPRMVCFVAVLIPRRTIEKVGMLDERFVGYGLDDDDYSKRVLDAGLQIGIFDGCFVDHSKLKSSYRGEPAAGGDFRPNLQRFIEKWGVDNWGNVKESSSFPECFPA